MIAAVLMDNDARLFVDQQDVFILIDDIEPRGCLEKLILLFRLRVKEFVTNEKGQHIALLQLVGDIAFFAVALDALLADVHIHHRLGHGGKALLQKLIQALTRVVLFDFQRSHSRACLSVFLILL